MNCKFPLFQSHLDLAHHFWKRLLKPGDAAIDATCGNGHDSLLLAELIQGGELHCIDIQRQAIETTRQKLKIFIGSVYFHHGSHAVLPEVSPKIIVYNLGYLPGGDKNKTTQTESTLSSLKQAARILAPGGLISITCYPGHEEGAREKEALLPILSAFSKKEFAITTFRWENRKKSPSLVFIQKNCN